jgi:hypothetical protein
LILNLDLKHATYVTLRKSCNLFEARLPYQ